MRLRSLFRLPGKLQRRARRSRITTMLLILLVLLTLITPFYIVYKPPSLLIRYFQHRWPDVLWQVSIKEKVIALTIDDGPSEHTREILEILKENNATATFFVIGGQVSGRMGTLKDIVRGGNELANHAMHDEPSRSLSDSTLTSEIATVEEFINTAYSSTNTTLPPRYFRPGSGFFSDRLTRLMDKLEYQLVLGSIYPHDPQIPYWRVNARHILSMLRPGAIIICHDRRAWTPPMLRKVLLEMKRRGYRVVTVTELLKQKRS